MSLWHTILRKFLEFRATNTDKGIQWDANIWNACDQEEKKDWIKELDLEVHHLRWKYNPNNDD